MSSHRQRMASLGRSIPAATAARHWFEAIARADARLSDVTPPGRPERVATPASTIQRPGCRGWWRVSGEDVVDLLLDAVRVGLVLDEAELGHVLVRALNSRLPAPSRTGNTSRW